MDFATELAQLCIMVKSGEGPDLPGIREKFEALGSKERLLRAHAGRYSALASARATDEDTSLSGYASTAAKRLSPIPYTGAEALVRGPAAIAGGVLGYQFGKKTEGIPKADLQRVLSPVSEKGGKGSALLQRLTEVLKEKKQFPGATVPKAQRLIRQLSLEKPSIVSDALRERYFGAPSQKAVGVQDVINKALGPRGVETLRTEIPSIASQTAKKGIGEQIASTLRPRRIAGVAGGALAGGAVAGLPWLINALYQKQYGGEAAARARSRSEEALEQAEQLSQSREDLLSQLPKTAAAPADLAALQQQFDFVPGEIDQAANMLRELKAAIRTAPDKGAANALEVERAGFRDAVRGYNKERDMLRAQLGQILKQVQRKDGKASAREQLLARAHELAKKLSALSLNVPKPSPAPAAAAAPIDQSLVPTGKYPPVAPKAEPPKPAGAPAAEAPAAAAKPETPAAPSKPKVRAPARAKISVPSPARPDLVRKLLAGAGIAGGAAALPLGFYAASRFRGPAAQTEITEEPAA